MEGNHYCWVTLRNPQTSRLFDEFPVFFETHPLTSMSPRELLLKNSDTSVKTQ